jgi:hypothetical protein
MASRSVQPISFNQASIDGVPIKRGHGFQMDWENAGRTPALRVDLFRTHAVVEAGADVPTFILPPNAKQEQAPVLPGTIVTSGVSAVPVQTILDLEAKRVRLFLYGRFTYETVFQQHGRVLTECCFEVMVTGRLPDGGYGFQCLAVGPQNRAT